MVFIELSGKNFNVRHTKTIIDLLIIVRTKEKNKNGKRHLKRGGIEKITPVIYYTTKRVVMPPCSYRKCVFCTRETPATHHTAPARIFYCRMHPFLRRELKCSVFYREK